MEINIYHLYHSGVAVETNDTLLIFDYSNDRPEGDISSLSNEENTWFTGGIVTREELNRKDRVYVFVSHKHGDHYNPVIFDWEKTKPGINYILSDDIQPPRNIDNIVLMKKDEEKEVGGIKVKTFGSTDQGVSFLVELDKLKVFHAGDLNWWHWSSFSEEQLIKEEKDFKKEINKLKGEKVDIAFIPVDPRLGDNYNLAANYFIQQINPGLLVPIHFGSNYSITRSLKKKINTLHAEVAEINTRGQLIPYNH